MNKYLRIFVISLILLFAFYTSCLAVNIDMNLTSGLDDSDDISTQYNSASSNQLNNSNSSSNAVSTNTFDDSLDEESNTVSNTALDTSTPNRNPSIADNLQALPESELGLTNILNILLIAVGFVLILLAIAIFIRLKK